MSDDKVVEPDPYLNITHELSWEQREGFAGILVTVKVNGEVLTTRHVATASGLESEGRFTRRKGLLKDLFDRCITWEEFVDLTTDRPRAKPARRDEDGTAQPLTRIIHHPPVNSCVGPGLPLHRPEHEDIITKVRTPIR